jgi:beta-N-acetylglucosaminidase
MVVCVKFCNSGISIYMKSVYNIFGLCTFDDVPQKSQVEAVELARYMLDFQFFVNNL